MDLDGGIACLDFVNSGLGTLKADAVDRLHTYQDLLTLAGRLSLLDKKIIKGLTRQAAKHPTDARAVLERALQARLSMQDIFGSIADGQLLKLNKKTLDQFNGFAARSVGKQVFTVYNGELLLSVVQDENDLMLPLDSFILSGRELLLNKDQRNIKRCGRCQWLFLDETKSHRRKWCSMKDCGSIIKSSRYYQRKKAEQ